LERAREIAPLSPSEEAQATLVVLGHGTERHAGSGSTTHGLVDRLREVGRYRQVLPAFLDQPPRVDELLDVFKDPHVILVPFFMSEGWHVGTTIPEALSLSGGRTRRGSMSVWYARAVGTHPSIAGVVGEIVSDEANAARDGARRDGPWAAGEDPGLAAHPETVRGGDAPARVREAREAFLSWIGGAGPNGRSFLQAVILPRKDGRFQVRHVRDRDRDPGELRELGSPEDAADVAARSSEGCHRPLKTSPDLATGWRSGDLRPEEVWEVFAHVYPTAPVHRHLFERGRLSLASFEDTAARQTGMYEGIGVLPQSSVATLVDRCCAPERCLRVPTWAGRSRVDPTGVPCPEPCSLFVSGAREALDRSRGTE
jgi:sirohydrochlorin cobaltochelatase